MSLGARVLNTVERVGNRLPDPVFLFLWLIAGLIALSLVGAGLGWSAVNPVTGDQLVAQSLLSPENLERLIIGMPRTSRRWGSSSPSSTARRWPKEPGCSPRRFAARF